MMRKIILPLILMLFLALAFACGSGKDHHKGGGDGGGAVPGLQLVFQAANAGVGDNLWCTGPGLGWVSFPFSQDHLAVINNAQIGTYTCNIEMANGDWVVYSPTQQRFGATVYSQNGATVNPFYTLTVADIVPNGLGGGNWQFGLNADGTITGAGGPGPGNGIFQLIFQAVNAIIGDHLWCTGPNLGWVSFDFNASHQAIINNAEDGNYICNIQLANGNWVVFSPTQELWGATVNTREGNTVNPAFGLTTDNIIPNGLGGGNWQFTVNADGSINDGGTVVPPPDPCGTPVPSTNLVVVLKSYHNVAYVPQIYFSGTGWVGQPMTRVAPNRFSYTISGVASDELYTLNFRNPGTGEYLFPSNSGDFVVMINGVQVNQLLGNDLVVDLNTCAVVDAPQLDLNFRFTPASGGLSDVELIFGQDVFQAHDMTLSGAQWQATLQAIPPGRYEANISYFLGTPDVAVWPDQIKGTITVNGTTMTTDDVVVYAEDVPLPDPTGAWLVYVRANLIFDVFANGTVVGVDLGDATVIIIIPAE